MKILLINSRYYPNTVGGAEISVQLLAETLAINGYEPVVITASPDPGVRKHRHNGVSIYYVGVKNLYNPLKNIHPLTVFKPFYHLIDIYNPWMKDEVGKILDTECPDIIHTHNLRGFSIAAWSAATRRKIKIIHTLRDYYLVCLHSAMFNKGKNCTAQCGYCRVHTCLKKRMSGLVNAVVGVSSSILKDHLNLGYFRRTKIREVVFGPNRTSTVPSRRTINAARPIRLGFMGQLKQIKGIELLLKTVKKLSREDYSLWIGGKGTERYEKHLKNRYLSENIHFLGFVEPERFFNDIDILVVPSLWKEPLARVVYEAYAYGVPVVASNRGGLPEIVEDGKTGFVFDPDHPDQLSSLILKMKKNPDLLVRMQKAAKKKSLEFVPERSISKYIKIIQAAICEKSRDSP